VSALLTSPTTVGETSARVLVVDDEAPVLEVLTVTLGLAGFQVRPARSCAEARQVAAVFRPHLAVLDVMLPDGSGLDLCRSLRAAHGELGVIFLTARAAMTNKIDGLVLGDDYITKPFSIAEVVVRLQVLLRRIGSETRHVPDRTMRVADLELNPDTHMVRRGGTRIDLSPTEFRVLAHLLRHSGLVVSKQQLIGEIWRYDFGDPGAVEKIVSQLRRKLGGDGRPALLHTVRGFGYTVRASPP
jgi:two-component system OmpR family response regulator